MTCANCSLSELDKLVACDECAKVECQTCTGLSTTELRCVQLKKRTITYECENCKKTNRMVSEVKLQEILTNIFKDQEKARAEMLNAMEDLRREISEIKSTHIKQATTITKDRAIRVSNQTGDTQQIKTNNINANKPSHSKTFKKGVESSVGSDHTTYAELVSVQAKKTHDIININKESDKVDILEEQHKDPTWQTPKYHRARKEKIVGKAKADSILVCANEIKMAWFAIGRIKPNITEDAIKDYTKTLVPKDDSAIDVKKIYESEHSQTIRLGVNYIYKDTIADANSWPQGLTISRFGFHKKTADPFRQSKLQHHPR